MQEKLFQDQNDINNNQQSLSKILKQKDKRIKELEQELMLYKMHNQELIKELKGGYAQLQKKLDVSDLVEVKDYLRQDLREAQSNFKSKFGFLESDTNVCEANQELMKLFQQWKAEKEENQTQENVGFAATQDSDKFVSQKAYEIFQDSSFCEDEQVEQQTLERELYELEQHNLDEVNSYVQDIEKEQNAKFEIYGDGSSSDDGQIKIITNRRKNSQEKAQLLQELKKTVNERQNEFQYERHQVKRNKKAINKNREENIQPLFNSRSLFAELMQKTKQFES